MCSIVNFFFLYAGKCDPGEEYNLVTKACEPCSVGFHTVRPTTEKCVQCPPGTTTLDGGANVCVENKGIKDFVTNV